MAKHSPPVPAKPSRTPFNHQHFKVRRCKDFTATVHRIPAALSSILLGPVTALYDEGNYLLMEINLCVRF